MKKKFLIYLLAGTIGLGVASCKKFLDVNDPNPNSATFSTPELVLPQAITHAASNFVTLNGYGARIVGYQVNAGGFGGWGNIFTYEYTTADFGGIFLQGYNNILDLNYVIENTDGQEDYTLFNGAARIMRAYAYINLVNEYNDIPYTEAAQGRLFVTPKYDKAEDIYRDLADQLDQAIAIMKSNNIAKPLAAADVMFNGDVTKWAQFANTLKLKLHVYANGKGVFSGSPTFSADGFLTDDALVNPGYQRLSGKQNPMWDAYHSTYTANAQVQRQYLPSRYVVTFYNGLKISDPLRGAATFRIFPNTPVNFLGNTPTPDNLPTVAGTLGSSPWYIGTAGAATGANNTIGILKGSGMGQPIMLAAESYFLQAEAAVRGIMSGNEKSLFESGIKASFRYLYKDVAGNVAEGKNPVADAETYIAGNPNSRLVNYDLATSADQKIEAIITQQYIAYNNIGGHISWANYRRTGFPRIVDNGGPDDTFVSTRTMATTPDKLPGRILYPELEYSLNKDNVPTGISVNSSYVFWDRRK